MQMCFMGRDSPSLYLQNKSIKLIFNIMSSFGAHLSELHPFFLSQLPSLLNCLTVDFAVRLIDQQKQLNSLLPILLIPFDPFLKLVERRQTGTVKYKQDVFLLFHMVHIHEVIIFEPQSPGHPTPALWPQYDPSPSPPSLDEVNQRLFFWCCYQNVCPMVDIMRRSGCWCIAQSGMSFRHYCARSVSF